LKQQLKSQLFDALTQMQDPRMLGQGDVFDQYPFANPRNRDFYNRFMKGEINWKATGWVDPGDFETEEATR
jgi:N-sulfoglucosamine sulfohydrolase